MINPLDFLLYDPKRVSQLEPRKVLIAFMASVQYHDALMAFNAKVTEEDGTPAVSEEELNAAFGVFHDALAEALDLPELKGIYKDEHDRETTHQV